MDKRIWLRLHRMAAICLAVFPLGSFSQGLSIRSDGGTWGGVQTFNVSNAVGSATSGKKVLIGIGTYGTYDNAIWVPEGIAISGLGPALTEIQMVNSSSGGTTNGGAFYLSDNTSLSHLFINQVQSEQFIVAPIGTQRKNQIIPAQTAANKALTSTNVFLRGVRASGVKLQAVVVDCTNTAAWNIYDCEFTAVATVPLCLGTTPNNGAGEEGGWQWVTETNSVFEVKNTSLRVSTGGIGTQPRGAYISRPGRFSLNIGPISLNRAASSQVTAAVEIAATNATVDLTISGGVSYTFGTTNTYDLYITGSTNTVIIRGGVTNVFDAGTANTILWASSSPQLVQTNFISGQLYTNSYGDIITVSASAVLTEAAAAGLSVLALEIPGVVTNPVAQPTAVSTLAGSVTNMIYGMVPAGGTYSFTNKSSGAGNSATVTGGQIRIH